MTSSAAGDVKRDIYLEIGQKKSGAVAIEWPGWCRFGRDEAAAVAALLAAAPRYAAILAPAGLPFAIPASADDLISRERVLGNSATDFGAPSIVLDRDADPLDAAELERLIAILGACWSAFDAAVAGASGRTLRKGPRGGGRDLNGIVVHVLDSGADYLRMLGWPEKPDTDALAAARQAHVWQAMHDGMVAQAAGELPTVGPRGGQRWPARYFARRAAWHIVDHIWEIEDRLVD